MKYTGSENLEKHLNNNYNTLTNNSNINSPNNNSFDVSNYNITLTESMETDIHNDINNDINNDTNISQNFNNFNTQEENPELLIKYLTIQPITDYIENQKLKSNPVKPDFDKIASNYNYSNRNPTNNINNLYGGENIQENHCNQNQGNADNTGKFIDILKNNTETITENSMEYNNTSIKNYIKNDDIYVINTSFNDNEGEEGNSMIFKDNNGDANENSKENIINNVNKESPIKISHNNENEIDNTENNVDVHDIEKLFEEKQMKIEKKLLERQHSSKKNINKINKNIKNSQYGKKPIQLYSNPVVKVNQNLACYTNSLISQKSEGDSIPNNKVNNSKHNKNSVNSVLLNKSNHTNRSNRSPNKSTNSSKSNNFTVSNTGNTINSSNKITYEDYYKKSVTAITEPNTEKSSKPFRRDSLDKRDNKDIRDNRILKTTESTQNQVTLTATATEKLDTSPGRTLVKTNINSINNTSNNNTNNIYIKKNAYLAPSTKHKNNLDGFNKKESRDTNDNMNITTNIKPSSYNFFEYNMGWKKKV